MLELAYDMGVQLGLGHPRSIAAPYGDELRRQLVAFVGDEGEALWEVSGRMFRQVWDGWEQLRR